MLVTGTALRLPRPPGPLSRIRFSAPRYDRTRGRRDVVAGLTVAAVSLPQAMAYALIAGVDPRFGVYSAIVVTLVASILGSSSHLINGPTSAISLLTFSSLAFLDGQPNAHRYEALFLLAILVGAIQIAIALFRLGDLTRYISEAVIIGFIFAAAFLLALGQVGNALGVKDRGNGHMEVLHREYLTLFHGDTINPKAVVLSVGAVVLAIVFRRIVKQLGWPQIDMLLVLIVTGVVAYSFGWTRTDHHGKTAVNIAGHIPTGLPTPHLPDVQLAWLPDLSQGALAVAFIGIIEALSIAKAIAHQTDQKIDYNRQILAEGLANLIGGLFRAMPGSGSLTRSAINFQAGAATRFSGIVASVTVAAALLLFAPLMRYVPQAALAGLLLVTAARLVDFRRLRYALRASRVDAAVVIVTAVTGIVIDLDKSVLLGIALSILLFVPRAARLKARELVVTDEGVVRERLPGDSPNGDVLILDLEGELFFGAAPDLERYLDTLASRVGEGDAVVLRVKRVRSPDVVCIEILERFLREQSERGTVVLLAGVHPDTLNTLRNVGLDDWFPAEQVFPEEDEVFSATLQAVRFARHHATAPDGAGAHSADPAYYLV
jgi:SulP family sulfate permease